MLVDRLTEALDHRIVDFILHQMYRNTYPSFGSELLSHVPELMDVVSFI